MILPERFEFTNKPPVNNEKDLELYRVVIDGNTAIVSWGSGIYEGSTTYPVSSVQKFVDEGTWVIQEEEMKLPESFKFTHAANPTGTVYDGDLIGGKHFTVTWRTGGSNVVDYQYTLAEAEQFVKDGTWVIQPESFDKADTFNFIEASMHGEIFDGSAERPEGIWEDVKEFCKETNAVVTIFPEYFQVATRGEVTRLSTVTELLELIDAVRTLNKYKLA